MKTNADKLAEIAAAEDYVHTDEANLVKQVAAEHAIVNMGQDVKDFMSYSGVGRPERLFHDAFNCFYQQSESDEMAAGTNEEFKSWFKQAKKDIATVKKAKLPLTFRNVRMAFDFEGPFAGKK